MAVPHWLVYCGLKGLFGWVKKRRERKRGRMMTNGMKSSEFWVTIAGFLTTLGAKWLGEEIPWESVTVLVGYVLSRGFAKYTK